jgi:hypothetical protein
LTPLKGGARPRLPKGFLQETPDAPWQASGCSCFRSGERDAHGTGPAATPTAAGNADVDAVRLCRERYERGAALSGATVTILDGPNARRSVMTGGNGTFTMAGLVQSGFTVRATLNGFIDADRGVTLTQNVAIQLRLRPRPEPPPPAPPPSGSGAQVTFATNSLTCRCTVGTIRLMINGSQVGSMSCSPEDRSFDVSPGQHRVNACDNSGCWGETSQTIAANQVFRYTMSCSSGSSVRKAGPE